MIRQNLVGCRAYSDPAAKPGSTPVIVGGFERLDLSGRTPGATRCSGVGSAQADRPGSYGRGMLPERVRVAVVGAGFAGVGAAVELARAGHRDVLVLEQAPAVGGTWRDNTYPGCACDVPSHLYSFSFAPNPGWTRSFSPQEEIQAYLKRCAEDFGV